MAHPAIVRSDFDSAVFGVEFFRVVRFGAEEISAAVQSLPAGPLIADAKVAADDFDAFAALDRAGFRRASTLVEFGGAPDAHAGMDGDAMRRLTLSASDLEAHARGFRFQRFR